MENNDLKVNSVEQVVNTVDFIRKHSGDFEAAHVWEDKLYVWVLRAVAEGHPLSAELAKAALESQNIDFQRVCA